MASPDPLVVGTRFVKQFYNTVSENPESIPKFYGSSQTDISMGENAARARSLPAASAAERFAGASSFDLQAIDAQGSVNGGILLVVTGQIVFPDTCKQFVHIFFLNPMTNKKGFYVHNDVLRFIDLPAAPKQEVPATRSVSKEVEEKPPITEPPAPAPSLISPMASGVQSGPPEPAIPEPPILPSVVASKTATSIFDSPGHGIEESKEAVILLEENADEKPGISSWASKVASGQKPLDSNNNVASGSVNGGSLPSSPNRESAAPPPTPSSTKPEPATNTTTTPPPATAAAATTPSLAALAKIPVHKRNPECTLIVKNIDNATMEPDIRSRFESFGECSITVQANRGIAFVDYVTPAPVLAALAAQPFSLRERTLEIYQKTATATRRKSYHRRNNGRGRGGRGGGNNTNNSTSGGGGGGASTSR